MASIAETEDVSRLIAQYFELVELRNLTIPSSTVLKNPITQIRIYNEMFNEDLLAPVIPPAAYRLRLLKKLIAVIENDQQWDPEEDEIIEPLMTAMTDLMAQPIQEDSSISSLDTEEPQLSFSRGLIYGSGSTGFRTWEAALHLGTYLSSVSSDEPLSPASIRGKRIVELGAGTGFVSLLCQKFLGAERVLMTDGNAKLVDVFNGPCLEQNGFVKGKDAIEGRQWLWGEPLSTDGTEEQFDFACGADLTYDKAIIPLLVDAISRLFSSHGVKQFVIAATIRNEETFGAFLDACRDSHFVMEKSSFESQAFENQTGFFHSTQVPIWIYIISPSS
uniref:Protein-lysine N-methyltransferase EFM3 n=1 Tax=Talaromyces marneffei PM1 TaxID=1077442 RepID=A0A093VRV0_TALMA